MRLLRHLIQLILMLLATAFGAVAVVATPVNWQQVSYLDAAQQEPAPAADFAFTARGPPLSVTNVAITGNFFATMGVVHALPRLASLGCPSAFSHSSIATNTAGAGRYSPSQPLDAAGNPIVRTNDRGGVLVQPDGSVTCGQHACGMVLNTQGRPVAVDDIIRTHGPDFASGSSQTQLQRALRESGVGSTAFSGRSVSDLGRYTSDGRPAIAIVQTGPDTYHAVVVDGVTTRGGQRVVAIRDPAGGTNGGVYYETVSSFEARFTGQVIRMNNQ